MIKSFETPDISLKSNTKRYFEYVKILRFKRYKSRLFNAGSGQFYGNNKKNFYNINSKIEPQNIWSI